MEEDIKIVEEIIRGHKGCLNFLLKNDPNDYHIEDWKRKIRGLENLLTRYKQLEEENKKFRNGEIVTGKLEAEVRKNIFRDLKDYIPKSKVKEKIEEIDEKNKIRKQ